MLSSCGSAEPDKPATSENPTTSDAANDTISGDIEITGSSTVEPIMNLLAESFAAEHPSVAIAISGPGSGDGHKAACAGEVAIWTSSRQIAPSEAECLAEAGIKFVEMRVAIDGISVITSAANDTIDCLSFADLYSLVGIEATGFGTWSDANGLNAELGGSGPFADDALTIFAPGEESGTFDSFIEIALEDIWEQRAESGHADHSFAVRPDYNASANDNVIIDGVSNAQHSLGWVGFAYADANRDTVNLIEIKAPGSGQCVAPADATIASGEFPLSRFLYVYIDPAQASSASHAFIDFMLSDEGQTHVTDAGYVNLSDSDLAKTRANWADRNTGIIAWD